MSRILPIIAAVFGLAAPAMSADIHQGPVHPGWGLGKERTSVTVIDRLGSPPLPYGAFKYPLDDASYFNPPHPAAEAASGNSPLHAAWCSGRYSSYRSADNTFLPPRGQRRICVSPYR